LEPEVSPGDRVVVDLDGRWEWGVVVIGNYKGDVIAKRYYGDELRGHTGDPVPTAEVDIIGVAVDVTKPLRRQTG
jgi:SOS-response transcriptional repressor LexA